VDEDELRVWTEDLRAFADEITDVSRLSHAAVENLKDANASGFVKTMAGQCDHHHRLIMDMREPMRVFAEALELAADAVVATNIVPDRAEGLFGLRAATNYRPRRPQTPRHRLRPRHRPGARMPTASAHHLVRPASA
jgi:hypothetical protein